MELATVWLEVNSLHDNARLMNVTPAEAQVYRTQFGMKTEDSPVPTIPFIHLEIVDKVDRKAEEEYSRLARKFGKKLISGLFPGANPPIPMTFKEAGFESIDNEPKKGKDMVVTPLAQLPRGDDGSDMEPTSVNPLEEIVRKQQEQIQQLMAHLKPASDSTIESNKAKK